MNRLTGEPSSPGGSDHCEKTGKLRFGSRDKAAKSRSARRNKGARMRPYLCEHCHGWHLTTERESRRPKATH